MAAQTYLESRPVKALPLGNITVPKQMQASCLLLSKGSKQFDLSSYLYYPLYAGVCGQCRGDHLKTVASEEADSELLPEPRIHELSSSAEFAEE